MIAFALAAFLFGSSGQSNGPGSSVQVTQLTVTQSVIIRVPARRTRRGGVSTRRLAPLSAFSEHKGPRCVDASAIGAAAISSPDGVDFILKGGKRVRARLEDACPALDYYSGFYVKPPKDGKICAGRDSIRTRSGGDCLINKFRSLTPAPTR